MKDNYRGCPPFEEMTFGNGDVLAAAPEKEVYIILGPGVRGNVVLVREETTKLRSTTGTFLFTMSPHEAAEKGYLVYKKKGGRPC